MLSIKVTPTTIYFAAMGDSVYKIVDGAGFEIKETEKGYTVTAAPAKLYSLIVELSRDFDLEIV